MKKGFLFIIFTLPMITNAQGVKWTESLSWDDVKQKAIRENKFIFLDCYATWCLPCKQMDKDVYRNDSVARILNDHFISVRVQCDKTKNDNEEIKNWYNDADSIQKLYPLTGFPSLLIFDPLGKLLSKEVGYRDAKAFIETILKTEDPNRRQIYSRLDEYNNGKKDYPRMIELIKAAEDLLSDKKLAEKIAYDYKSNYLDNLPSQDLLTEDNIQFILRNPQLLKSRDRLFQLMLTFPSRIDSMIGIKGATGKVILYVINKEEIVNKLWLAGRRITDNPNWGEIEDSIYKKYGRKYVNYLVPIAKVAFYYSIKNWTEYVRCIEVAFKLYPPKENGNQFAMAVGEQFDDPWALNGIAWKLFLKNNDKKILEKALRWSTLSIKLCKDSNTIYQYLDTKANLIYKLFKLYKVGKIQDAILLEKSTLQFTTVASMKETLASTVKKMQNGEKTWLE